MGGAICSRDGNREEERMLAGVPIMKVVMTGMQGGGKTYLLSKVISNNFTAPMASDNSKFSPTIGSRLYELRHRGLCFAVWDIGGNQSTINHWQLYLEKPNVIIYLIDANKKSELIAHEDSSHIEHLLQKANFASKGSTSPKPLLIILLNNNTKNEAAGVNSMNILKYVKLNDIASSNGGYKFSVIETSPHEKHCWDRLKNEIFEHCHSLVKLGHLTQNACTTMALPNATVKNKT